MKEYNGKNLIIMACSDCNINCNHCYISYKGNFNSDEMLNIVKELKNKYNININGSEILTNIDYLKSLKEIEQTFLMSNGKIILDNKNIISVLKDYNINSISLSYHYGIQDDVSPISLNDLNKIMNILNENDINYRLLVTINKNNIDKIEEICDEAFKLGSQGVKFTNFISQGRAVNMHNDLLLSDNDCLMVLEKIDKMREKYNIEDLLIERCGTFDKNIKNNNFHCSSINDLVVLTPDYNIYPCVFLAKPGYEIGKLIDNKIMLYDNCNNNGEFCLSRFYCNKEKVLVKK